jgi:hypothetical protein
MSCVFKASTNVEEMFEGFWEMNEFFFRWRWEGGRKGENEKYKRKVGGNVAENGRIRRLKLEACCEERRKIDKMKEKGECDGRILGWFLGDVR